MRAQPSRAVVFRGGEGAAQPGAVQVQIQAVLVTAPAESGELRLCVDGADLRGVGDVRQPGQYHVLRAVVPGQNGLDQRRGQLAVRALHSADLVAGGLHGSGLVDSDVARGGSDHRLIGLQKRIDGDEIHLGAAHEKVDGGLRSTAQAADGVRRGGAVGIHAVADGLFFIGIQQGPEDSGAGSLAVIIAEAVGHGFQPLPLYDIIVP